MDALKLARKAGFDEQAIDDPVGYDNGNTLAVIQRFADLVRDHWLEEAAKVCEAWGEGRNPTDALRRCVEQDCAAAIRAMKGAKP